jgi:hypothetical protein
MQFAQTTIGSGFALHKVMIGKTKCSAYYNADRTLADAERFDVRGRSYSVKRDGPLWRALQRVGCGCGGRAWIVKLDTSKAILTRGEWPSNWFGSDNSGIREMGLTAQEAIESAASLTGVASNLLVAEVA